MQLFFVKLRVRIDMFSIRFRIWYSYIQKRGNATPHVQELVASSVWVVAIIRVFGIFLYGSEVDARVSRFRPDNEAPIQNVWDTGQTKRLFFFLLDYELA